MADAPYCNVKIVQERGDPKPAKLQLIPPNATLKQVINIINNNYNLSKGNFVENRAKRASTIVRIFDPDDPNTYVDVRQITGLEFINPGTGQLITFRR